MFRAINPQNSLLPWTTWTVSTCCGIYRSISHQLAGLDTLMVPDASIPVSMIPRYIQVLVSMTSRTTYQGHYSWSINEKENRVSVMTRYQHPSINHTQKPRIKTKNVGICARYWSSARKLLASFNTSWSTSVSFVGSVPSNGIIAHSLGVVPDNFHNHPLKFGFKKTYIDVAPQPHTPITNNLFRLPCFVWDWEHWCLGGSMAFILCRQAVFFLHKQMGRANRCIKGWLRTPVGYYYFFQEANTSNALPLLWQERWTHIYCEGVL